MLLVLIIVCRTILLSVISLLNEPNTFSPANVDASVMFRKWRDSKGKDNEYEKIVKYVDCNVYLSSASVFSFANYFTPKRNQIQGKSQVPLCKIQKQKYKTAVTGCRLDLHHTTQGLTQQQQ